MLHLGLDDAVYEGLREHLLSAGIRAERTRWVLHLDVGDEDVAAICAAIEGFVG
jgi:hypothetical protein